MDNGGDKLLDRSWCQSQTTNRSDLKLRPIELQKPF